MPLSGNRWRAIGSVIFAVLLLAAATVALLPRLFRVEPLPSFRHQSLPIPVVVADSVSARMPNGNLLANVGEYQNELTAYLRLQYLRSLKATFGQSVLMTTREVAGRPRYTLYLGVENDVMAAGHQLASMQIDNFVTGFRLVSPPQSQIEDWLRQTRLFDAAYERVTQQRLLKLPRTALTSAVGRFIYFKRRTDRRVREQLLRAEQELSLEESQDFAADIIDVAGFYDIPLDMLLGIGAMENNYIDVAGDLKHTAWKRRAQPGDIVLRHVKGRVMISNSSIGPWQITRQTLRYAHELYLHDKRDYSQLPPRLRPAKTLDFANLDTHVLTTYAGILLRDLLEAFNGDVARAEGAYNGGRRNPNLGYAEGVANVADYARRVLSAAISAHDRSVETTVLTARAPVIRGPGLAEEARTGAMPPQTAPAP